MPVAEDLHFEVARAGDVAFKEHARIAKARFALADHGGKAFAHLHLALAHAHPDAPAACAMRAASRSLSPKRISSVATESFSLITGTTCSAISRRSVAEALRKRRRSSRSSSVTSICAAVIVWSTDGSAEWLAPWTWFTAARWDRIGDLL